MGDCISRQAVLELFGYVMDYWKEHAIDVEPHEIKDALIEQYEFTAKQLKNLPPVKPQYTEAEIQKMQELEQAEIQKAYELEKAEQSKTGHWIAADGDNAICSCCNRLNRLYGTYCKHCGAKNN